jgi:hypothetical protein
VGARNALGAAPAAAAASPAGQRGRWILAALAALLAGAITGCGKGSSVGAPPPGAASGEASADTLSSKQILQRGGLCADERVVDDPEEGSDEWIIYRMYQLAIAEDSEESFQAFRALFPASRNTRQIREMYWPRLRQNVHKFMNEPGDPAYTICRIVPADDGIKYFIQTSDRRQHPPPITIGEADGGKKVLAFTPF